MKLWYCQTFVILEKAKNKLVTKDIYTPYITALHVFIKEITIDATSKYYKYYIILSLLPRSLQCATDTLQSNSLEATAQSSDKFVYFRIVSRI
jgi:hypothetical protein